MDRGGAFGAAISLATLIFLGITTDMAWARVMAVAVGMLLTAKLVVALRAGRSEVGALERSLRRLTRVPAAPASSTPPTPH